MIKSGVSLKSTGKANDIKIPGKVPAIEKEKEKEEKAAL